MLIARPGFFLAISLIVKITNAKETTRVGHSITCLNRVCTATLGLALTFESPV